MTTTAHTITIRRAFVSAVGVEWFDSRLRNMVADGAYAFGNICLAAREDAADERNDRRAREDRQSDRYEAVKL